MKLNSLKKRLTDASIIGFDDPPKWHLCDAYIVSHGVGASTMVMSHIEIELHAQKFNRDAMIDEVKSHVE